MKTSLSNKLKELFETKRLFTLDQLADLCDSDKRNISNRISRLKNPAYADKNGKLDLTIDVGYYDGIHRWGLRGSTVIYKGEDGS